MTDRYTKAVLTVIAAMLVYNAVKNEPKEVKAAPAECGHQLEPCHVTLDGETITVIVEGLVKTYQSP